MLAIIKEGNARWFGWPFKPLKAAIISTMPLILYFVGLLIDKHREKGIIISIDLILPFFYLLVVSRIFKIYGDRQTLSPDDYEDHPHE